MIERCNSTFKITGRREHQRRGLQATKKETKERGKTRIPEKGKEERNHQPQSDDLAYYKKNR